jgi:isoleucyl-tRNA synthetase
MNVHIHIYIYVYICTYRTALAEAELEYPENHVSKSIYVGFRITSPSAGLVDVMKEAGGADLRYPPCITINVYYY